MNITKQVIYNLYMNVADIKSMFKGLDEPTINILARQLREQLGRALNAVNADMQTRPNVVLSPAPNLTLNAFRLCRLDVVKVVLLGQDPYIKPGQAQGLSFSVPRGVSIPPSLRNIYSCLVHCGLIPSAPKNGDLSSWASQGVLMFNSALTTVIGKSNAHQKCWTEYTDAVLAAIATQLPQKIVFILLGADAQKKATLIDSARHLVLCWGHPSPLSKVNQSDNPAHFKYCDVFTRANEFLGEGNKINWASICETTNINTSPDIIHSLEHDDPHPPIADTLWLFTDGGAIGNGRAHCKSSWGYYVTDNKHYSHDSGIVPDAVIQGKKYSSSNNRGELTAILRSLEYVIQHHDDFSFNNIIVVSDSKYSINCIDEWVANWLADETKLEGKQNLDLILPARELYLKLNTMCRTQFVHIKSHKNEPSREDLHGWFMWKCNDIVDRLCTAALQ